MNRMDQLKEINNKLKDYINESQFISNKCRNKIIKMLIETFSASITSEDYVKFANVDVSVKEDGKISLRGKDYDTAVKSNDISDIVNRFDVFKEKADAFLSNKNLSFDKLNNFSNIINIIVIGLIFLVIIAISIIAIKAIFSGNLSFTIWFIVFILPTIIPSLRNNISDRIMQAKNYFKKIIKRYNKR